jgi:hypothetical protein
VPDGLEALERGAGWWVKAKATLGAKLAATGNWLMSDLEKLDKDKSEAVIRQVQATVGSAKELNRAL